MQEPLIHFLSRENFGSLAVRQKRIHGFASHPCGWFAVVGLLIC
jgi:hypothetical protein